MLNLRGNFWPYDSDPALEDASRAPLDEGTAVDAEGFEEKKTSMTGPKGNPLRVLVVDDEPVVCDSIRMLLAFDGHSTRVAYSPQEALEFFTPADFDVVITDFEMHGLQGDQLALLFKKQAPELPVVLITAYAEMLDSWGTDLSAVDHVISKPFKMEQLRATLDRVRETICS